MKRLQLLLIALLAVLLLASCNFSGLLGGDVGGAATTTAPACTEHKWDGGSVTQAPTCTSEGEALFTCRACGATERRKLPVTGHEYEEKWSYDGEGHYHAPVCGCVLTVEREPHKWSEGRIEHSGSCEEATLIYTCTVCGAKRREPTVAHERFTAEEVLPTCTEAGYIAYGCQYCDLHEIETLPARGHSIPHPDAETPATCEGEGEVRGVCEGCQEYITLSTPATGHISSAVDPAAGECNGLPLGRVTCLQCGTLLGEVGHVYRECVTLPTCTEAGVRRFTCVHCNDAYEEALPAHGHDAGAWQTVTPPSCTEAGEARRLCLVCEVPLAVRPLAPLGHRYIGERTADGIAHSCTVCGDHYTEAVSETVTVTLPGSGLAPLAVERGESPPLPTPVREGYEFAGWYFDAALTRALTAEHAFLEDTTLYAAFVPSRYIGRYEDRSVFTDVALDFTFRVISSAPLDGGMLEKLVYVRDRDGNTPAIEVISVEGDTYTVGGRYREGMTYTVTLGKGVSFEATAESTLVFMTKAENGATVTYRDGVVLIPESEVYSFYTEGDASFLVLRRDLLDAGDHAVLYGESQEDPILAFHTKSEGSLGGLPVYAVVAPDADLIFESFEISYSGALDASGIRFSEDLEGTLTREVMLSPMYAQFAYAARGLSAGVTIGDYYYDFNGITVKPTLRASGRTVSVTLRITAEYARMHTGTREVDGLLHITLEVRSSLSLDTVISASGLENFTLALKVGNETGITLGASVGEGSADRELDYFRTLVLAAAEAGEVKALDTSYAEHARETKIGEIGIGFCGVSFSVEVINSFRFRAVGEVGLEAIARSETLAGITRSRGGFSALRSFSASAELSYWMVGKADLLDLLRVRARVSLLGLVSAHIDIAAGPYLEVAGVLAPSAGGGLVSGGYLELGARVEATAAANAGIDIYVIRIKRWRITGSWEHKTLFDEKWTLYAENFPFLTRGDQTVLLGFAVTGESGALSATCGESLALGELIDRRMITQNLKTLVRSEIVPSCTYLLIDTLPGLSLTESGQLTVDAALFGTEPRTVQIRVTAEGLSKTVTLTVTAKHGETLVPSVPPTCEDEGHTAYTVCPSCDTLLSGKSEPIPALGHAYSATVTPPTCKAGGYTTHTCGVCRDSYRDSETATVPHSYTATVTPPTCKTGGYTTHTCIWCPDTYRDSETETVPHSYTAAVTPPTCKTGGYTTHTCIWCPDTYRDSETEIVDHRYAATVTPPTCTAGGYTTHTCIWCPDTYRDSETEILPHSYAAAVTAPTCEKGGYTTYTCRGCGESYRDSETAPLGHRFVNSYCTRCGECEYSEGLEYILRSDGEEEYYVVVGLGTCTDGDVVIPREYNGLPVREISKAFDGWNSNSEVYLTSLTLLPNNNLSYIRRDAFVNCDRLRTVIFPEGTHLVSIEQAAFQMCDRLESVIFETGSSCAAIGEDAFLSCSRLVTVQLPIGLLTLGDYAFSGCPLEGTVLPPTLTYIGRSAIGYEGIVIPRSVKVMPYYAFSGTVFCEAEERPAGWDADWDLLSDRVIWGYCGSGTTESGIRYAIGCDGVTVLGYTGSGGALEIPELIEGVPVVRIAEHAFRSCASLTSVTIPAFVEEIGWGAFDTCTALASVSFAYDSGCHTIGGAAFYGCYSLSELSLPTSLVRIGDSAFDGCRMLDEIDIPASVISLGHTPFPDDAAIRVAAGNSAYTMIGGALCTKDGSILLWVPRSVCAETPIFTVPASVRVIAASAFSSCTELLELRFAEGSVCEVIENGAFAYCQNLRRLELPASLRKIGGSAILFWGEFGEWMQYYGGAYYLGNEENPYALLLRAESTELESVAVHPSTVAIADRAFEGCTALRTVTLPASLRSIGDYAFAHCEALTALTLPEGLTHIGPCAFLSCSSLASLSLPSTLTEIPDSAFAYCASLTSVEIPAGVTEIAYQAFIGCTSLSKLVLPPSLRTVGYMAFGECEALEGVYISDLVAWLGIDFTDVLESNPLYYADLLYLDGAPLRELVIPEGIGVIASESFGGYRGLTSVRIPASVTSIGSSAFYACTSLTSVTFAAGSRLERIGNSAFSYCEALEALALPAGVTVIEASAFSACGALERVLLPEGLLSIGSRAFYSCGKLTSLSLPSGLRELGGDAFDRCALLPYTSCEDARYLGNAENPYLVLIEVYAPYEISLPEGVRLIPTGAFRTAWELVSVEIPSSVVYIGEDAFARYNGFSYLCTALERVSIAGGGSWTLLASRGFVSPIELPISVELSDPVKNLMYFQAVYGDFAWYKN